MSNICSRLLYSLMFILGSCFADAQQNDTTDPYLFDDTQLEEELQYPDWFKITMGDLRDDLAEANTAGKNGLIVYFGQKRCAYCEQFIKINLGHEDIQRYTREHFNLVALDIWGIDDIIDTDGKKYTERELSIHYGTNFTPSTIFYDKAGKPVFRLRGYYPPYKFRAALKYVAEKFYKQENFRDYLERAVPGTFFLTGGLNERDFFIEAPHDLQKISRDSGKPLVVFFEQGDCHACDLLHSGPLNKEDALNEIGKINAVQLDMWSDAAIVTPDGQKTTAKEWAKNLKLFYTPTLIFFDAKGNEIIRLDSVVQYYRLWGVLDYINKRGYENDENYQTWRLKQRETN